jgi:drug/metabolite transporter (DMT)-like permease
MQAIGLMMGAVLMLSVMDVAIKMLVEHYSSFQVIFLRSLISVPLFTAFIFWRGTRLFRTYYPAAHLIRGVFGLAMLWTVGECFREMQLPDAYAIFFAAPLLITLLSGPVLGEPAGLARILAAVVGFSGVLVVLQPEGDEWITYGAAMGLLGVCFYAVSALLLRSMGQRDETVTITFWFSVFLGISSGLLAISDWTPIRSEHWIIILFLGVSGTFGQFLITAAFRKASVAVIAPFDYFHMFWALLFGYIFWGYIPGVPTWLGSAIIVACGLFIFYREHRISRRRAEEGSR